MTENMNIILTSVAIVVALVGAINIARTIIKDKIDRNKMEKEADDYIRLLRKEREEAHDGKERQK